MILTDDDTPFPENKDNNMDKRLVKLDNPSFLNTISITELHQKTYVDRLLTEYHVQYETRATHSRREVYLRYQPEH